MRLGCVLEAGREALFMQQSGFRDAPEVLKWVAVLKKRLSTPDVYKVCELVASRYYRGETQGPDNPRQGQGEATTTATTSLLLLHL